MDDHVKSGGAQLSCRQPYHAFLFNTHPIFNSGVAECRAYVQASLQFIVKEASICRYGAAVPGVVRVGRTTMQ
jgi:hypothetical protein